MEPDDIKPGKGRENWDVDGILAYSKICTHVGCPISLNERTTHHLLCPCHQSTFDLADSAQGDLRPGRPALPQLPLMVDEEGYLVAPERLRRTGRTQLLGARLRCETMSIDTSKVADSNSDGPGHRHEAQQGRRRRQLGRRAARPRHR